MKLKPIQPSQSFWMEKRATAVAERGHRGDKYRGETFFRGYLRGLRDLFLANHSSTFVLVEALGEVSGVDSLPEDCRPQYAFRCAKTLLLLCKILCRTDYDLEDLRDQGIPEFMLDSVDAINPRRGESNGEYLERVKANPFASEMFRYVALFELVDVVAITRCPSEVHDHLAALAVMYAEGGRGE